MKLTSALFDAYLKCPTKCYLRSTGHAGAGNTYAEWVREQDEAYQRNAALRLVETLAEHECADTSHDGVNLKTATWRLAVGFAVETETMASRPHAVERLPPQGGGNRARFIPIRFVFLNKLTKDDRLLLAFDALVFSEVLGRDMSSAKSSMATTTPR